MVVIIAACARWWDWCSWASYLQVRRPLGAKWVRALGDRCSRCLPHILALGAVDLQDEDALNLGGHKMLKKRLTLLAFLLAVLLSALAAHADDPDHLVTILTSDSSETQAMAMILTTQYVNGGGSAQVLLCDGAAELALEDSDMGSEEVRPMNRSPREMLGGLMAEGVEVQVCAIFLPNREETEDDLRDGVTVASPDAIAEAMAQPDTRLFTH